MESWQLDVTVPVAAQAAVETLLEELGGAVVSGAPAGGGEVALSAFFADHPGDEAVATALASAASATGTATPAYTLDRLPDTDWLAESYAGLPPIHAGRFFVYGEHNADLPRPPGTLAFQVDANQAFGTGHHESTRGCLLALTQLHKAGLRPRRVLDMGTGTGLLALAAARLWRVPVLASDNDAISVRIARENARLNRLSRDLTLAHGEGYATPAVRRHAPYDLVCANILANPLMGMAGPLSRHLAPGGRAVLAGILDHQAPRVLATHRAHGLVLERRIPVGAWRTLILRRPGRRR